MKRLTPEDSKKLWKYLRKPPGAEFNRQTARGRRNHGIILVNALTGCRGISLVNMNVEDIGFYEYTAEDIEEYAAAGIDCDFHVGELLATVCLLMKRSPKKVKVWEPRNSAATLAEYEAIHGPVGSLSDEHLKRIKIEGGRVLRLLGHETKENEPREIIQAFRGEEAKMLRTFMDRRPGGRKPGDPMFCAIDTAGNPIPSQRIGRGGLFHTFRLFAEASKIPGFTPHRVRHTRASELAEAGASLREIQRVMGWVSGAMAQVYLDEANPVEPMELIRKKK